MGYWILSAVLVLIGYIFYLMVRPVVTKKYALKNPTLETPLAEFKESAATDLALLKGSIKTVENISEKFERMCVLSPLDYAKDPSISKVVSDYKKLLSGEILDAKGEHIPSEQLNGKRNPDYETYMHNQGKAFKANAALKAEAKRLENESEEEILRGLFTANMVNAGFPLEVVASVLSDEKLNTFTSGDWRELTKVVKGYMQEYPVDIVCQFFQQFDDKKILFDAEKLEIFATFAKHSVPMNVVVEIVRGRITIDQSARIIHLVTVEGYTWEESMEEVLTEDIRSSNEESLKKKYREMLNT